MAKSIRNTERIIELKKSGDGSHTLFVPELNEHYHSVNGAYTESMHVFINMGLQSLKKECINVLEIGLGTALNLCLTYLNKGSHRVFYHALEKYPLEAELYQQLEFQGIENENIHKVFMDIHSSPWNQEYMLEDGFKIFKDECDLNEVNLNHTYDLVYFDAFAPDVQPELWSYDVFKKLYDAMNQDGVLTTYCAKGVVRRTLQECGFEVERLPGPPGKREMLRAIKR